MWHNNALCISQVYVTGYCIAMTTIKVTLKVIFRTQFNQRHNAYLQSYVYLFSLSMNLPHTIVEIVPIHESPTALLFGKCLFVTKTLLARHTAQGAFRGFQPWGSHFFSKLWSSKHHDGSFSRRPQSALDFDTMISIYHCKWACRQLSKTSTGSTHSVSLTSTTECDMLNPTVSSNPARTATGGILIALATCWQPWKIRRDRWSNCCKT